MKLPRALAQRPTPQMPDLPGFEPCFDPLPVSQGHQLPPAVRPLYWWAAALRTEGDVVVDMRFDRSSMVATITVRQASYRLTSVVRRCEDTACIPQNLPALMAEAVWRLGALGWTGEFAALVDRMRAAGVVARPAATGRCVTPIPRWLRQPDTEVRVAYWWAMKLIEHGWRLHACGDAVARHGFIAEIPTTGAEPLLVVFPGDMAHDGSEASALARHLARLGSGQRMVVQTIVDHAAKKRAG
ncbi:hypothetical protein EI067_18575 [Mycobacterium paragordonae]|nr:hypothetical protein [Mycobacterium sp.]TDK94649.1 hypothetical protein EI067_18575 [Mycobacterium paragordonae]TDL04061.1 hypothetical protein EUA05_22685 [Mycobacterium paragordonae]